MKSFIPAIGAISAAALIAPMAAMAGPQGQFPDVQPTNWAYQAILNLRDKYGCAVGFPDQTFRPGEPATRAQLAALTNACLDEITAYVDAKDAALAAALRAEVNSVGNRVTTLELEQARRAQGVGNYIGAGVLLNQQGVDGNGYDAERTIASATLQGRYALRTFTNQNAVSVRPYVNIVGSPGGEVGAGGGAMLSYDWSIAQAQSGVSKANLYAAVGYQVPFVNNTDANFQSAVGEKGQVMFAVGGETRLTNSLVGFVDVKLPTTTATDSYGAANGTYSPVLTGGMAIKF